VLRIVTADKLHNLRTIYRDLKTAPDNQTFWDIFTGGKEGTLWYYRSLEAIFQSRETNFYREEYSDVLRKVEALARKEPS
jgi:(p)ppGpp synthase/HD superfamily hydrolase